MLRLVNLEIVTNSTAGQHHRTDQEQREKGAVLFLRLGFRYFLHRFGGLWLWLRGHFFGRFLTLFGKRQKVVCGNGIEEIDVLAGFLFVDHQIKHALVCGGDGVELLATARQVISQLFRKAEDDKVFGAFSGQKGKLITGIVQQDVKDTSNVHVAVGDVEALLPRREQVPGERYRHGERIRVYVVNVARGLKGPEIVVSRSHPELVRRLFEREVPELVSGAVSIMAIAREAGARTKIAVRANTEGVNPKGALIGPGGARVRAVMENLGPEKIDIVDWSADPAKFVAAALSPAVATGVQVISEKNKTAIAFIHDDQLSLAIGKEGQNARLAAKLTGWKIGIESAEAHAKKMAESADHSDGETEE